MKNNWKIVKIPDILSFQEGPGVRKHQFTTEGVKLLNVGNINDGQINLSKTKIYISEKEAFGKYKHFLVDDGDLVIASSGIVVDNFHNKIAFIRKEHLPLCMNTSTIRFKVINKKIIDITYFKYFLKTKYFSDQLQRLITGSAQLNFGPSHLKKIDLLLPPLEDQKYIVKVLDQADSVRQKRKKVIKLLDDYIESVFLEMFGDLYKNDKSWTYVNLGDLISTLTDYHANGSYQILRKNVTLLSEPDYALMVRTTDLENNNFVNDVKYIDQHAYNFLDKSKVFGGEIIINKIGSAGKVYLMPKLNRPVSLGMNAFLLRFNKKVDAMFMYYLLTSNYGESIIQKKVQGAVTKTIRKDAIRSLQIPLISIDLQNKFLEIVYKTESLKQKMMRQSQQLDIQFQALMQKSFALA